LLGSVPRLDSDQDRTRLEAIEGAPPDLGNLNEGCSFAERCRFSVDSCYTEAPVLKEVDGNHKSACSRVYEIEELSTATGASK
jgi:oligopeptide/dipeptide ABC transporter ATP-binding protein